MLFPRAMLLVAVSWLTLSVSAQSYHDSEQYRQDTAEYGRRARVLFAQIAADTSTISWKIREWARQQALYPRPKFMYDWRAGLLYYYEKDTLRCVYNIDSYYTDVNWQTAYVTSEDTYPDGTRRTSGEFLIIRDFEQAWVFPVNQHRLYRRNGTLKSIACFDRYGNAVRDSVFNRNGKFKRVRKLKPPGGSGMPAKSHRRR